MEQNTLKELTDIILMEMKKAGFNDGTVNNHAGIFKRILRLADRRKEAFYSRELGEEFICDNLYVKTGE